MKKRTTIDKQGLRQGRSAPPRPKRPPIIRWRKANVSEQEREQVARSAAELLLGLPQRRLDAPEVLRGPDDGQTTQALEPISFQVAQERFAGLAWNVDLDDPQRLAELLLDNGKTPARIRSRPKNEAMTPPRPRKAMTINRRPGNGGRQLNSRRPGFSDATAGVEQYGEISWRSVAGGASIGIVELDPSGNAAVMNRLSARDLANGETLINQVRPNLALAERFEELRPRLLVLAYNMSGTREVRVPGVVPMPGELEREDLTLLLEAIDAGWCEHAIWRDGDRVARDIIPGELLIRELKRAGMGMWLAGWGRRIDYVADRLALRATMMVSAEERANLVRRTQIGAINKGPLRGQGWRGQKKFGFVRDANGDFTQDKTQAIWIQRAFVLADTGNFLDESGGLSTRKVTDELAKAGCPFDHDRIRTILKDPVYATGEYTVNVRGVPVSQTPIKLNWPVPLDQFLRVQNLLALRNGSTKRTDLGEFILNYVDAAHSPCQHQQRKGKGPPRVRGYVRTNQPDVYRYRHSPFSPTKCHGTTWEREELEHPVILAVHELAKHPEIRRQLEFATRHERIISEPGAGPEDARELERQLVALEAQDEEITQDYVVGLANGGTADVEEFAHLREAVKKEIERVRRQLAVIEAHGADDHESPTPKHQGRLEAFIEILSLDPPDDPYLKALRARLFQRVVSRVVIEEVDGQLFLEIESALAPEGADPASVSSAGNPILATADLIDAEIRRRGDAEPAPELKPAGKRSRFQTDLSPLDEKSVWRRYDKLLNGPSVAEQVRVAASKLDSTFWKTDHRLKRSGVPAWRLRLELTVGRSPEEVVAQALTPEGVESGAFVQIAGQTVDLAGKCPPPWPAALMPGGTSQSRTVSGSRRPG